MKKTIAIVLLIIICIGTFATGCANKGSSSESSSNSASVQAPPNISTAKAYVLAFDEVWKMDEGLNADIKYVSVNTKSFKDFSEDDRVYISNYISSKYQVTVLDMNMDELKANGYVADLAFKEGILFEANNYITYTDKSIIFEGMKWRSGDGAVMFKFEAKWSKNKWELVSCNMTGIS